MTFLTAIEQKRLWNGIKITPGFWGVNFTSDFFELDKKPGLAPSPAR